MKNITAVILAAGRGTRMKSDTPKVLHKILGKPMISHLVDTVKSIGIGKVIVVIGHGEELLKESLKDEEVVLVTQKKLLGSGDAVNAARRSLGRKPKDIMVLCGDAPLVTDATLIKLAQKHKSSVASATILTARVKDPSGYGRIIRSGGKVIQIVEDEKLHPDSRDANEINTGLYCFNAADLFDALSKIKTQNKKKEYFLTDTIEVLNSQLKQIEAIEIKDPEEAGGINTRRELTSAIAYLKEKILGGLMDKGVTIEDPASTVVYPGVDIGPDTIIYPNTVIESNVKIGRSCHIGPFARLRGDSCIDDNAEIGNFVEIVRTKIGKNTKVKHHTYLGDAVVGKNVNIGAGAITANYDGKNKNRTIIEDGAFIGVGAILIAPVRIGRKATVGAGCVVPKGRNVPDGKVVVGVPARELKKK